MQGRTLFKRAGDVVAGGLLLLISLPLQLVAALLILSRDGGPVFFRQERIGLAGRPFRLLKFRTMRVAGGNLVTTAGDPRITPLGRWLRRYKLDELPQLWQVVGGRMSLVGPRPEVPAYVARYPAEYRRLGMLRPGLTDFASLIFRDEEDVLARHAAEPGFYLEQLLPRKLALARLYRRHLSLGVDCRLVLATACLVVGQEQLTRRLVGPHLWSQARTGF